MCNGQSGNDGGSCHTGMPSSVEFDRIISKESIASLIEEFGRVGGIPGGGVTRLAFSPEDLEARKRLRAIFEQDLGLKVRIDAWSNVIARRPGRFKNAPPLMTGSHLDTVRNGGKFDGSAGIIAAIKAVEAMNGLGILTEHPIEIVVFSAEEPNEFGMSTIGSRGMTGKLKVRDIVSVHNMQGQALEQAIAASGGDPERLDEASLQPGDIKAFVELHIEQATVLERMGKDIGVVKGIAGINRTQLTINGEPNHSGTTSMAERRDALVAASSLITALNTLAIAEKGKAVATVGHIEVEPNAINVIPGEVKISAETRSYFPESTGRILEGFETSIAEARQRHKVEILQQLNYHTKPKTFSPLVRNTIHTACSHLGLTSADIITLAGHDANHMSDITHTAMLFVPSHLGLSHCPDEWTPPEALAKGSKALLTTLLLLDKQPINYGNWLSPG